MKVDKKVKDEKELTMEERIELWKQEHGKIFQSIVAGKIFIWRRIKRREYTEIMEVRHEGDTAERIYQRQCDITKKVVLNIDTEELEECMEELAGLATSISDEVLDKSGFGVLETIEL